MQGTCISTIYQTEMFHLFFVFITSIQIVCVKAVLSFNSQSKVHFVNSHFDAKKRYKVLMYLRLVIQDIFFIQKGFLHSFQLLICMCKKEKVSTWNKIPFVNNHFDVKSFKLKLIQETLDIWFLARNIHDSEIPANETFSHANKIGQLYLLVKFLRNNYGLLGILENSTAANAAVSKVKVTYTDQQPPILTMEDAIQKKSIFPKVADELKVGDAEGLYNFELHMQLIPYIR